MEDYLSLCFAYQYDVLAANWAIVPSSPVGLLVQSDNITGQVAADA